MQLTADQALRKELLFVALTKQSDLAAAFAMAVEMERFVLEGPVETPEAGEGLAADDGAAVEAVVDQGRPPAPDAGSVSGPYGSGGTKRRWSEDDDAALKTMWHSSASLDEIAEILERTTPSLYCRARALGLAKRAPQPKAAAKPALAPQRDDRVAPQRDDQGDGADKRSAAAPGDAGHDLSGAPKGAEATEFKLDRFCMSRALSRRRPGPVRAVNDGGGMAARTGVPKGKAIRTPVEDRTPVEEMSVDSIIQFLRSRDYSVVRISEGRFRLDGRRELSVDELRAKANQVRKMLGQSPFVSTGVEAVN